MTATHRCLFAKHELSRGKCTTMTSTNAVSLAPDSYSSHDPRGVNKTSIRR
jgi:hypothetical protein